MLRWRALAGSSNVNFICSRSIVAAACSSNVNFPCSRFVVAVAICKRVDRPIHCRIAQPLVRSDPLAQPDAQLLLLLTRFVIEYEFLEPRGSDRAEYLRQRTSECARRAAREPP